MINDKNKLKVLIESIISENYIDAKDQLENVVESTVIAHFKNVLENKEIK